MYKQLLRREMIDQDAHTPHRNPNPNLSLGLALVLTPTLTPTLTLTRTHTPDQAHRVTDRVHGVSCVLQGCVLQGCVLQGCLRTVCVPCGPRERHVRPRAV